MILGCGPLVMRHKAGAIDKEYCYLLLNNAYLTANSWLNSNKVLDYTKGQDIFLVNGLEYEDSGDTPAAQDKTTPLYSILILKRKTSDTGIV